MSTPDHESAGLGFRPSEPSDGLPLFDSAGQPTPEEQLRSLGQALSPDFSAAILSRVNRATPFADAHRRRTRRWARLVGGAALVGLSTAVAIGAMWAPEAMPWANPGARPLSRAFSETSSRAAMTLRAIERTPQAFEAAVLLGSPGDDADAFTDSRAPLARWAGPMLPMASSLRVVPSLGWQTRGSLINDDAMFEQGVAEQTVRVIVRRARSLAEPVGAAVGSRVGSRGGPLGGFEPVASPDAHCLQGGGCPLLDELTGGVLGAPLSGPR